MASQLLRRHNYLVTRSAFHRPEAQYYPEQTFRQELFCLADQLKIAMPKVELHSSKVPPSRIPNCQAGLTGKPVILTANHQSTHWLRSPATRPCAGIRSRLPYNVIPWGREPLLF
ncbi:uncharacterized protein PgNI_07072 [Pyricularia grisea]|uniref:Uncharacterized protein n=1 Tax=Pyricularia grisea TaxID=148305 RepID=A0A6P8B213_PYRGI|nr:uncharacterized protein PgNI_07072 [Pyricularia grisea]TLD08758.1 hypothetical protein PgNI_07072 [Pyricularia grisea]